MRLHVATASHSRREQYITVNGTRYSDMSRDQTLERSAPEVDHWHNQAQTPEPAQVEQHARRQRRRQKPGQN